MGRRGPPPKPTALKRAQGTYRADRAAPAEMTLPLEAPPMPKWLDAEGKAEWQRIVPVLADLQVLAKVDESSLADYCAAHSLAVKAARAYQREGLTIKTPFGPQTHPMLKIAREARAQANVLAREFGLTPAARTRISTPEKPKANPAEADLFGAPGAPPALGIVKGGKS